MIDIRQFRYFVALAETLHFGRAAERLNVTQPPLSRQIAALEAELGVRLVDRGSRHAQLTEAGRQLLDDARAAIAAFDQACRNAQAVGRGELGALSIGFMMHAAYTVLPAIVRRYMDAYPRIELSLKEIVPGALVGELLAGRFDAGLLFSPGEVRGLETRVIHQEALALAVPTSHRLAGRGQVAAADIAGEPLIASPAEATPTLRDAIVAYCHAGGFEPHILLEAQLQSTLVNLVGEGLGVAFAPASLRKLGVAGAVFVELEAAPVIEHVVAWRPGNLNPALRPFLDAATAPTGSADAPHPGSRRP